VTSEWYTYVARNDGVRVGSAHEPSQRRKEAEAFAEHRQGVLLQSYAVIVCQCKAKIVLVSQKYERVG